MGAVPLRQWEIYLADVPFEDLPQSKLRPVIILEDGTVLVDCLKMTSQPPRPGEYLLQRWAEAGLRKPTTVRLSKRLALPPAAFRKRLGELDLVDIFEISKRLTL